MTTTQSRRLGRLFCCLISALVVLPLLARAAEPAKTIVADTVYRADGTTAKGTILIAWPAFSTADGKPVAAGKMSVKIAANGGVNIPLIPTQGATPAGTAYKVVISLDDGSSSTEYWSVPTLSPTTIAAIRSTQVPATVAMQVVSREYVDAQLATALRKNGDETIYGVKTFVSSPLVPTPGSEAAAANKGYVDAALAAAAPEADTVDGKHASEFAAASAVPSLPLVDVTKYGAKGDVQVATDCTAAAGSPIITCASNHFVAGDQGKVAIMYHAGPGIGSSATHWYFRQPFASTIATIDSPTQVTLAAPVTIGACPTEFSIQAGNAVRTSNLVTATTTANIDSCIAPGDLVQIARTDKMQDDFTANFAVVYSVPAPNQFTYRFDSGLNNSNPAALTVQLTSIDFGPGTRFAWGANDQAAVNAAMGTLKTTDVSKPVSGYLYFPSSDGKGRTGRYFADWIDFECTQIGQGGCTYQYQNVGVAGDGWQASAIEGMSVTNLSVAGHIWNGGSGLISAGGVSANSCSGVCANNSALRGFVVRDITVREPDFQNTTGSYSGAANFSIYLPNTWYAQILRTRLISLGGPPYLSSSVGTDFEYNWTTGGWTQPGYNNTQAGINDFGPHVKILHNKVTASGQFWEGCSHDQEVAYNTADFTDLANNQSMLLFNTGSVSWGCWDMNIHDNTATSRWAVWVNGGQFQSAMSSITNNRIDHNVLHDIGPIALGDGAEVSPAAGRQDAHQLPAELHGTSTFTNNTRTVDPQYATPNPGGIVYAAQRETWRVSGNSYTCEPHPGQGAGHCAAVLGIHAHNTVWQPAQSGLAVGAVREPRLPDGCVYSVTAITTGTTGSEYPFSKPCTPGEKITDSGVTWLAIKHGELLFSYNPVTAAQGYGAAGSYGAWYLSGVPDYIHLGANEFAYPVLYPAVTANGDQPVAWAPISQPLPAGTEHSEDVAYYNGSTFPDGGLWHDGERVLRANITDVASPSAGFQGWQVNCSTITGCRRGVAWAAGSAYAYDAIVRPAVDNGHFYIQTTAGGCTSQSPGPPTWNSTAGTTTADNNCAWLEAGATPSFHQIPFTPIACNGNDRLSGVDADGIFTCAANSTTAGDGVTHGSWGSFLWAGINTANVWGFMVAPADMTITRITGVPTTASMGSGCSTQPYLYVNDVTASAQSPHATFPNNTNSADSGAMSFAVAGGDTIQIRSGGAGCTTYPQGIIITVQYTVP